MKPFRKLSGSGRLLFWVQSLVLGMPWDKVPFTIHPTIITIRCFFFFHTWELSQICGINNSKKETMKKVIVIAVFLIGAVVMAQDQYTQGMQKAFQLWGEQKNTEAAHLFERIGAAEQDNWLPPYYAAQINTIASFGEKDKEKLTQQLDRAQELLDLAKAISPDNPEILVQQAMIYTAWVAFDGATYGPTLSGKVVAQYRKALELDPQNPRAVFSKAEWDMGTAKYFGQDTAPYCKDVERSLELFTNFKPETAFHPNWGKERAEKVLENCKA